MRRANGTQTSFILGKEHNNKDSDAGFIRLVICQARILKAGQRQLVRKTRVKVAV